MSEKCEACVEAKDFELGVRGQLQGYFLTKELLNIEADRKLNCTCPKANLNGGGLEGNRSRTRINDYE